MKRAIEMAAGELAAFIDQSVLKPEFTQAEIRRYIQEGIDYGCKAVCVNPSSIGIANGMCDGTRTLVCAVCDFPFGLSETSSKIAQAEAILDHGVAEVDVVVNYGWLKSGLWDSAFNEIKALAEACHKRGAALKAILETDALTLEEIIKGTKLICGAGADFAKTSTGFYTGGPSLGATPEVVGAMLDAAEGKCKIKASGGIRSRKRFLELVDMGIGRAGIGYRSTPVVLGLAD